MTDTVVSPIFCVHLTTRDEMEKVVSVKDMISLCCGGFQFT